MEFKDVEKILIIKLRHIGDVLLTIPAIRVVRETFPSAYIAVLVNKGTEEVLTGNPLIDEVIVYDRGVQGLPFPRRLKRELGFMRMLRGKDFDMTIDLTSGDRPAILSLLSGARYRLAYDPEGKGFWGKRYLYTHLASPDGMPGHVVLQNLYPLRQFRMETTNLEVTLFPSVEDEASVDNLLKDGGINPGEPFIHIHPLSRWLFKCWKDEYMAEVIRWLLDNGMKVVVTSSPDKREMEKAKGILSIVPSQFTVHGSWLLDLCGRTTLKHLAVISKRANLFFGIDSAPMHIAAAVGTPVVALFGPTGAYDWGPWDNKESSRFKVQSLRFTTPYPKRNGVQRSTLHTVIQRDWDCVPCGKDGCNGSKRSECLEDIKVEEVIKVFSAIVTGRI